MPLIGIDASRLATGERTGTEQYTAHLLPALLGLDGDERYRLYTNRPPARPLDLGANAEWRAIPFPRLWTHARLATELRRHRPDLLFVPAHVLPWPCPVPAVVTVHDLGYLHFPGAHTATARLYLDLSTRWSARSARRVIAISEATRRDLVAHYRVSPAKIDVVYHGIAPRFRPPTDPAAARAAVAALGVEAPYVLAVGTIQPRKNYPRLIAAIARLRAEGHDVRLVIAGRVGWLAGETLAAPPAHGIASHVNVLGYVPDAVLPDLMAAAAAVALPSLYEGLGMPAAEALACGAPLVCSTTSALPEVAGDAAFPCDPLSVDSIVAALRQALTDAGARAVRRERGLARAAAFTWERCARETRATLRAALAAEGGAPAVVG
jgi:glycosyltransferase involved in cell wall biosynthesis